MHGQRSRASAMCFTCGHSDPAWRSFTMRAPGSRSPGLWSRCCRGTAKAAVLQHAQPQPSKCKTGLRTLIIIFMKAAGKKS